MKKVLSVVLVVLLLCTPLAAASYVDNSIKVSVNGQSANTQIVMNEGSVFVPLRFMSNQLGANVNWDSKSRTVSVKKSAAESKAVKTYPEPLIVSGSDTFKKTISQSLSLLKSKQYSKYTFIEDNVHSINEADLNKTPSNMAYTLGVCSFDLDNLPSVSSSEKQVFIAGTLVHEAHHAWLYNQGLFGEKTSPMTGLDAEVLANSIARQTIKNLGGSSYLMSITSVDWIIDHNYSGSN